MISKGTDIIMQRRYLVLAVALALPCLAAAQADLVIHQRNRAFSSSVITVARGQPVIFLNDDTVPHNAMSASARNAFDLGSQLPGTATPVTFDQAGIVAVTCAIHPRMRMTIIVTR